jgi:hypothetical protein
MAAFGDRGFMLALRLCLCASGTNSKMARTTWIGCVLLTAACATACSSSDAGNDDGAGGNVVGNGSGGSSAGVAGTQIVSGGGSNSNQGGASAAGTTAMSTGGASMSGGTAGALGMGGVAGSGVSMSGGSAGAFGEGGNATGGRSAGGSANDGGKSGAGGGSNNGGTTGAGGKGQQGSGGKATGGAHSGGAASGGAHSGGAASGGGNSGGSGGADPNCPEGAPAMCGMVAAHNEARAGVMPVPSTPLPDMSWSASTAAAAQAWADQCNWSHNTMNGMYGQNLYASAGSGPPSPQDVVDSWVSEDADYDYASNSCSSTCGHYTQVVWRNSTQVGCAIKECTTGSPFGSSFPTWYIVVCNYLPPGNFVGQKPY